jgi:ubiquitin C-terminal hydrolase
VTVAFNLDDRLVNPGGSFDPLLRKSETGFVGLLNQGATCYLNSLIQSLYATPELRNYLFEWEFDPSKHGDEKFCIPRQLQLLFARLTSSEQPAVGTKDLTHSFHWSTAESFRQHDVQELMRVLFDAIERTLRAQETTSLFDTLYQGYILDYLNCPDCGFKRQHKDRFNDISLAVQNIKDVETALANYVEPEILSGDNKWRCGGCNEKVEAKKGLMLTKLPDILTIQLKRFVFDFARRARVKVHNKVTFPTELNMATYAASETDDTTTSSDAPLFYDLFAILMHSGTAMGGHYFAFIRDATNNRWSEFNDVTVSYIEEKDAFEKAFGGRENGACAYMLMYRRRDIAAPETAAVPTDALAVVQAEDKEWREERERIERERRMMDINVIFESKETQFRLDQGVTVAEAQQQVYEELKLKDRFALDQIRLRKFASEIGFAQATLDDKLDSSLIDAGFARQNTLIVETRKPDEPFPEYNPNEIPVRVLAVKPDNVDYIVKECNFAVNLKALPKDSFVVRIDKDASVAELKEQCAKACGIVPGHQRVVNLQATQAHIFHADDMKISDCGVNPGQFLYIEDTKQGETDIVAVFEENRCQITIEFNLPGAPTDGQQQLYGQSIRVSRNITLAQFKEMIAPVVNIDPIDFRLRSSVTGPQFKDESQTLSEARLSDHSIVYVELGRPLGRDEFNLKFFYYDAEAKKQFDLLFELPFSKKMKVHALKEKLLSMINELKPSRNGNEYGLKFMRLRERQRSKVGKIFQDNLPLGRCVRMFDGQEIVIQKIEHAERVTSQHRALFIQHFFPDRVRLAPKVEVVIRSSDKILLLKEMISTHSSIPVEHIGIAKGVTVSRMKASHAASLNYNSAKLDDSKMIQMIPARDGDLIVYQDNRTAPAKPRGGSAGRGKASRFGRRRKYGGSDISNVSASRRSVPERGIVIRTQEDVEREILEAEVRKTMEAEKKSNAQKAASASASASATATDDTSAPSVTTVPPTTAATPATAETPVNTTAEVGNDS